MDFKICRICFEEVDENNSSPVQNVANIIMFCVSFKINPTDRLPQFICTVCSKKAWDAFNFRVLCEESDMYLKSHKILQINENPVTTGEKVYNSSTKSSKKTLKCHTCSMVFYYKKPLIKHEQKHKEGFKCKDCGKSYASAKHLATHSNLTRRKGYHLCQMCGKTYTMPENLKRHQRIHNGIKPFVCQKCDKSFTQSNQLKSHMISHSSEKKFLCNFCGHKYARRTSLQVHITRIHTNVTKQYKCRVCDRAFKGMVDMKIHQVIHTNNRKFVCKVCEKAFNQRSNLKVHERIHTRQKPITCQICEKSFIQKSALEEHQKIHLVPK